MRTQPTIYHFVIFCCTLILACRQTGISIIDLSPPPNIELKKVSCQGIVHDGEQTSWIFQCESQCQGKDGVGSVALIGLPKEKDGCLSGLQAEVISSMSKSTEQLHWLSEHQFICWARDQRSGNEPFIFTLWGDDIGKVNQKGYQLHMVFVDEDKIPLFSTKPVPFDQHLTDHRQTTNQLTDSALVQKNTDPSKVQLEVSCSTEPTTDAQVGFFWVVEKQKALKKIEALIGSGQEWPTTPTFFNNLMVVPGSLQNNKIIAELSPEKYPISNKKWIAYGYLKEGNHFYLTKNTLSIDPTPPSNPQNASEPEPKYNLNTLDIQLTIGQDQEKKPTIKLTGNHQDGIQATDPVTPFLFFLKEGVLWRAETIEKLFKEMENSKKQAIVSRDQEFCLVRDQVQTLDNELLAFFSQGAAYRYLSCLCNTKTHKLQEHTKRKPLTIAWPKPVEKKLPFPLPILTQKGSATATVIEEEGKKIISHLELNHPVWKAKSNPKEQGFVISAQPLPKESALTKHIRKLTTPAQSQGIIVYTEKDKPSINREIITLLNQQDINKQNPKISLYILYWTIMQDQTLLLSSPTTIPLSIKKEKLTEEKSIGEKSDEPETNEPKEEDHEVKKGQSWLGKLFSRAS